MSEDRRHVFSREAVIVIEVIDDEQFTGANFGGNPANRGACHAVLASQTKGRSAIKVVLVIGSHGRVGPSCRNVGLLPRGGA